jgi:hypothetical protein
MRFSVGPADGSVRYRYALEFGSPLPPQAQAQTSLTPEADQTLSALVAVAQPTLRQCAIESRLGLDNLLRWRAELSVRFAVERDAPNGVRYEGARSYVVRVASPEGAAGATDSQRAALQQCAEDAIRSAAAQVPPPAGGTYAGPLLHGLRMPAPILPVARALPRAEVTRALDAAGGLGTNAAWRWLDGLERRRLAIRFQDLRRVVGRAPLPNRWVASRLCRVTAGRGVFEFLHGALAASDRDLFRLSTEARCGTVVDGAVVELPDPAVAHGGPMER